MSKLKAKDHYVKQEYLKKFALPNYKNKIACFDFEKNKLREKENVLNCAHENGFLNLDIEEHIKNLEEENIKILSPEWKELVMNFFSNPRQMDEFLTNEVEGWFNDIKKITSRYNTRNVLSDFNWDIVLSDQERYNISLYLAYQYLRTRSFRNYLCGVMLKDPKAHKEFQEYSKDLQKSVKVVVHTKFLINDRHIEKMAKLIYDCTWIVGVNECGKSLITSDNPVTLVRDPSQFDTHFFSGIETISFPLCSKMVLSLINPMNKKFTSYHNSYVPLQPRAIDYFNIQQALFCNRCIYGDDSDTLQQLANNNMSKKRMLPKQINKSLLSLKQDYKQKQ